MIAPYTGVTELPVSRVPYQFTGSSAWLSELAAKDLLAVRLGVLKFRGFALKKPPAPGQALADGDVKPDLERKGVDMRIGLDIATISAPGTVDRIVLITDDTDCVPAMKHGRKAALQVVLVAFPDQRVASELLHHADFHRPPVGWPA